MSTVVGMFIEYKMINNIEYAMLVSSVRIDGKVKKGKRINLGRVIDKQKSIYKNRERGLFTYNKETDQYGNVDPEFKEPSELKRKTKFRKREILDIEFGSVYLLDKFLEQEQIWKLVDAIGFKNRDSIRALLLGIQTGRHHSGGNTHMHGYFIQMLSWHHKE